MTAALRVLVVEDSLTVRQRLIEALTSEPGFEVVGVASSGEDAVARCLELRPNVITLDMMLDGMSGLDATVRIMARQPTPILIVSASTNRGELFRTYDALAAGAVDVLEKPLPHDDPAAWTAKFRAAVKMVARIRVIRHLRGNLPPTPPTRSQGRPRLVVIGASTGGPAAVVALLRAVPAPFAIPMALVVHIGGPFGASFAEWLDGQSSHRVRFARDREPLGPGVALAPPDRHLVLSGRVLRLTSDPERHSCRPSVDALFESAAAELAAEVAGCLLTGMGRDGAQGLLAIRRAGGTTLAQDEASSVVWGMPREAVQLGAAERVGPPEVLGAAIAAMGVR